MKYEQLRVGFLAIDGVLHFNPSSISIAAPENLSSKSFLFEFEFREYGVKKSASSSIRC